MIFAFEVWLSGDEKHRTVINHHTAAKAKYEYLLDIADCFERLPFDRVRSRKIGPPQSNERLRRVAKMRGRPELTAGTRVQVGQSLGYIVDGNYSGNFDVLFDPDAPECPGAYLNVHPLDIVAIADPPEAGVMK
jgi:hypothetical protein